MNGLRSNLAQFCIFAITAVLISAFVVQFAMGELPCPLCILQRMGMILAALGPAWLLMRATRGPVGARDYAQCYGVSILAAILGGAVSVRQTLLHIAPGDPGFGSPVLGMHLYSWGVVIFTVVVAVSGLQMLVLPATPERLPVGFRARVVLVLFGATIAVNALAVFALEGFHAYLPDNPTAYRLFHDAPSDASIDAPLDAPIEAPTP